MSCKICEKMLHTLFKAESSSDSLVFANSTYQRLSAFFFPKAISTAELIWTRLTVILLIQITGEVGNSAASNGGAPFIQLAAVILPEILAKRKVLQHDVRLALLQELLGKGHVGPEAYKCWRTRRSARRQQVLTRLRDVALL